MTTKIPQYLDFSVEDQLTVNIPVTGPDGRHYTLQSADGETAQKYRNASSACLVYTNGKVSGVKDPASVEPILITGCLKQDNGKGKLVPVSPLTFQKWPGKVLKRLFETARQISEIGEEGESPLRRSLDAALSRPDSPVSQTDFAAWVQALPEDVDELESIKALYRESAAKNVQETSTAGSESPE